MLRDAMEAMDDRLDRAEIFGHAGCLHALEQGREPGRAFGLAPQDKCGIDGERGEKARAIRRFGEQRRIEQELGPDVGGRAAWASRAAELAEPVVELAHEAEDGRGLVEGGVGRVVERDTGGDVGIYGVGEAYTDHRGEVGQHRAERLAGRGSGAEKRPARDGRVAEIVHTAW